MPKIWYENSKRVKCPKCYYRIFTHTNRPKCRKCQIYFCLDCKSRSDQIIPYHPPETNKMRDRQKKCFVLKTKHNNGKLRTSIRSAILSNFGEDCVKCDPDMLYDRINYTEKIISAGLNIRQNNQP